MLAPRKEGCRWQSAHRVAHKQGDAFPRHLLQRLVKQQQQRRTLERGRRLRNSIHLGRLIDGMLRHSCRPSCLCRRPASARSRGAAPERGQTRLATATPPPRRAVDLGAISIHTPPFWPPPTLQAAVVRRAPRRCSAETSAAPRRASALAFAACSSAPLVVHRALNGAPSTSPDRPCRPLAIPPRLMHAFPNRELREHRGPPLRPPSQRQGQKPRYSRRCRRCQPYRAGPCRSARRYQSGRGSAAPDSNIQAGCDQEGANCSTAHWK
eukprot:6180896-Pleurochrysis_carterae.AAC.3